MSQNRFVEELALIEPVLSMLWAPHDADPQAPAALLTAEETGGEVLTNNEVIRARKAYERLRSALFDQFEHLTPCGECGAVGGHQPGCPVWRRWADR